MQVERFRHKGQHSIHSRQTPPQCQRGQRSVLYCTSNCSNVMEMHVLKRWIVGFVSPSVELCCPRWHTLKLSRSKVDLSLCVRWVLQRAYPQGIVCRECVQTRCLSPIGMLPIVRLEAALSNGQQKALSPNVPSLQIHWVPLEWSEGSGAKTKMWINGGHNKRIYQLM